MAGLRRSQWLLFAGFTALVPMAAVCWRLGRLRTSSSNSRKSAGNAVVCGSNGGGDHDETSEAAKLSDAERKKYHAALKILKERANAYFQAGQHEEALETYQGCLDACAALGASDMEALEVHHTIRANVVLVLLKLQRPEEARMCATFLLQDETHPLADSLKVKVLYRRGLASQALDDRESALCDFRAALAYSPGEKNAVVEKAIAALSQS